METNGFSDGGVQFVLTGLDVALTTMDVADVSCIAEKKLRGYQEAREAYTTILGLLENLSSDATQRTIINNKLARLKTRLIVAGQLIDGVAVHGSDR